MLSSLFLQFDAWCSGLLPGAGIRVAIWAAACGAASMALYWRWSPQGRLQQLAEESKGAQLALQSHDGEFAEALPLMRKSIGLALQRVQTALVPSLLAGLPMILFFVAAEEAYRNQEMFAMGPLWVRSWVILFLAVSSLTAVSIKVLFRIK